MPEVSSGTVASLSRRATGPGGSGKTRLCIAVAAEVAGDYPDGVYFVSLAPVRDPRLLASTIVQSIGLQDARDVPLMEHLISQLRERQLLIVLDNFEHLLTGAPVVTRLLRETTAVRILVSSRAPLHVSGEQECPVPPLAVPGLDARPTAVSLAACESVRLFTERAAGAVPGFTLDDENAPTVAQIARRLDGLPLAIELAAARVKLLPPEAILPSLEAIEAVCDAVDTGLPVLDGLQELVDQSLLRQVTRPGPVCYATLETIR